MAGSQRPSAYLKSILILKKREREMVNNGVINYKNYLSSVKIFDNNFVYEQANSMFSFQFMNRKIF